MSMDNFCVKQEIPDFYPMEEELNEECAIETVITLDFLEHCVLCLRKLVNDSIKNEGVSESNPKPKRGRPIANKKMEIKDERPVPEATFSWSLTTFSHIWPYLNEKWKRKVGDDISPSSIKFVRKLSKDDLFNVTEVPPICEECGAKIQELDKLHQEITNKVLEIHNIIKNSGPNGALSWRDSAFEQDLKNVSNSTTLKLFLTDLRDGCTRSMENVDPLESTSRKRESETFQLDDDGAADAANEIDSRSGEKKSDMAKKRPRRKYKFSRHGTIPYRRPTYVKRKLRPVMYNCEICNERLRDIELEEHVRAHVQDYLVKCPNSNCLFVCATMAKLESGHFKRNPKCAAEVKDVEFKRECETCGFEANHKSTYRLHVSTHETTEKHFPCPIEGCPQAFTTRACVSLHLESHEFSKNDFENQRCESCKKQIPVNDMKEHYKKFHKSTEVVKCLECQFVFMDREALINHLFRRHKDGLGRSSGYQCDICKDGVRHTTIRRHYYEAHSVGTKVVCEYCNMSFFFKDGLELHKRSKHGPGTATGLKKRKNHICKKCDVPVEFESLIDLFKHNLQVHDTSPYRCTVCNKPFLSRSELLPHQKTHDPNYKNNRSRDFICGMNECKKTYMTKTHLARHQREYHIDPKDHICDVCGHSYRTSHILKKHKRINHEGKESCVCHVCGGRYLSKYNLRVHMRSHTGEKPYQCEICGKGFTQKCTLLAHNKVHQKNG